MRIHTGPAKFFLFFILCLSWQARGDNYHYRENLIGDRAAGLGGAYIAISDDPSGIWYNPAGIIFSFENYYSLSANVFGSVSEVYKNVFSGRNYTYASSGLVPNFFGFTQNYGKSKWGFAMLVPNEDRIDQDDDENGLSSEVGQVTSFKRKYFRQNSVTAWGFGIATEATKNFTIGTSIFAVYHVDKQIDNQFVRFNPDALGNSKYLIQNGTVNQSNWSALVKLGMQWMPKKEISVGSTIAKKVHLTGSRSFASYATNVDSPTTVPTLTPERTDFRDLSPLEVGVGVAWFPRPTLLVAADLLYFSEDKSYVEFAVQPTWNAALGMEYYFAEKSAIRLGFYTNNANTPQLTEGRKNQLTHVDMTNVTLGYSHSHEGSTFSFGAQYGAGKGQGQAIGESTAIQEVIRTSFGFFLTGSYQL